MIRECNVVAGGGRISQLTNEHREGWEARVCGRYRGTEVADVAAMAGSGKAFYIVRWCLYLLKFVGDGYFR